MVRPDSVTLTTGYDSAGNVSTQTDGLGRPMTRTYDVLDRLSVLTDTLGQPTTYAYDRNSNQQAVTDALSQTTVYTYDAANQTSPRPGRDGRWRSPCSTLGEPDVLSATLSPQATSRYVC